MKFADFGIIVGAVTGITGMVLGIYNTIVQRRNSQPRVLVLLEEKFIMMADIRSEPLLCVTVQNHGEKAVCVQYPILVFPKKKACIMLNQTFAASHVEFPVNLEPGHNFATMVEKRLLAESMKSQGNAGKFVLQVVVTDAIERRWKSKTMEFDVDGSLEIPHQPPFPLFAKRDILMEAAKKREYATRAE